MAGTPFSVHRIRYGADNAQEGDLYRPAGRPAAVVALLHGGFWKMPYGRDQMDGIARDLAGDGFAAWNIGYRRVGAPGGGFPGTIDDACAAIDHLAELARLHDGIDPSRVILAGHSAGGHLALCVAARARLAPAGVRPRAVAALAAISDLAEGHRLRLGGEAVARFLGGPPEPGSDRLAQASPVRMLPLGVPVLVAHGLDDDAVPPGLSQRYAASAIAAGDPVELALLPGADHMAFLEPGSAAWKSFRQWLDRVVA